MFGKRRIVALGVSASLVVGLTVFAPSSAGAASLTHRFSPPSGTAGTAFEPRARVVFVCNSKTNTFKLSVRNIIPITSDQFTAFDTTGGPVPGFWIQVTVGGVSTWTGRFHLSQDFKNGTFGTHVTVPTAMTAGACGTGLPVEFSAGIAANSFRDFERTGPLS
jgi:hypothetical protein